MNKPVSVRLVRIVNPAGLMPGGIRDFPKMMQQGRCFVDKSLLIREVLHCAYDVMFITRPRRFGKTTNQSLLQAFLSSPPRGPCSAIIQRRGCMPLPLRFTASRSLSSMGCARPKRPRELFEAA